MSRQTRLLLALGAAAAEALAADETLRALVGGRIHDGPPRSKLTPHVALAEAEVRDFGHGDAEGARVRLTVEAVTAETRRTEALVLIDRAAAVLAAAALPLGEGTTVVKRLRETALQKGRDGRGWRARVVLDVIVDG